MLRVAIILNKDLSSGEIGNCAAILMGHAAAACPDLYSPAPVIDADGQAHAGIRYSVVLLKGRGSEMLANTAQSIGKDFPHLGCVVFSRIGQSLNNAFDDYKAALAGTTTPASAVMGLIVFGGDADVRTATRKFSLLT